MKQKDANTTRLLEAAARLNAGLGTEHELIDVEENELSNITDKEKSTNGGPKNRGIF